MVPPGSSRWPGAGRAAAPSTDHAPRITTTREWEEFWAATRTVELSSAVERHAGELSGRHALRGTHAVHLASALAVGSTELVVAVWDQRLHRGAVAERLMVAPQ